MTFVDRIDDARDLAEVFELVNELIKALYHSGEPLASPLRCAG